MTAAQSMQGYAPVVKVRPIEKEIYRQLWDREEYRLVAPGESCAQVFCVQARPPKGSSVIDFGCGTGRGGLLLALLGGLDVTMVDFAANCLDADIKSMLEKQSHALRFVEADLTKTLPMAATYGFCTDVLEHIPPAQVDAVLNNVLRASQHCFFQISTVDDVCGALVGHQLHLSIHPYAWWLEKFRERDALVHWSQDNGDTCLFYVTAWIDGPTVVAHGALNTTEDVVKANVKTNISGGWNQIVPHPTNDTEVMIVGGGPSLANFVDDIKQKRADGVKLITINGSYNWCLEHDLKPSALIMVDARPFNARFAKPVVDGCTYFIASQCDPSVLEGLPKERTYLWHTSTELIKDVLQAQYEAWWGVPGGSTVLLRAIPLLRMLGFRKFHLYGCDSCLSEDEAHHAYAQPENDSIHVIPVSVTGGRIFKCHPWMIAQSQEMMDLIKMLGDEIELEIYGDGLLAHILKVGAKLAENDEPFLMQ